MQASNYRDNNANALIMSTMSTTASAACRLLRLFDDLKGLQSEMHFIFDNTLSSHLFLHKQ